MVARLRHGVNTGGDSADGEAVLRVQSQLALADGEQPQLGPVLQGRLVGVQHGDTERPLERPGGR